MANETDNNKAKAKELAKTFLYLQYSGPTDTLDLQYELSQKYTSKKIDEAIESLKFDGDFGDMNRAELHVIKTFLETDDKLKMLSIPAF